VTNGTIYHIFVTLNKFSFQTGRVMPIHEVMSLEKPVSFFKPYNK